MHYYYGYDEFIRDTKYLTQKIDWEFDTIIGIARGGLSLAHILGEYYNIREVYTINTIGYEDTQKLETTELFNIPNLSRSQNILIVDDIVDSGDTLKLVIDTLSSTYPHIAIKSATLFYKPSAIIEPHWYAKEAEGWIDFFWSEDIY